MRSAHVLVVEAPGGFTVRVAAERGVVARGWRLAESPASADVLLVAGAVGGELEEAVERVWEAMPGPRARVSASSVASVSSALDEAAAALRDEEAVVRDAATRVAPHLSTDRGEAGDEGMDHGGGHEGMDHGGGHEGMDHGGGHEGMDHGGGHEEMDHGGGHEGMDHGGGHEGMDHGGGHEGMDHGGMDMAPDGIPVAEGSEEDRDGLEMDELPVRLGPVLPHWPAGLVLDVALHGDLVARATARLIAPESPPAEEAPAIRAARACDDVVRLLALAGWDPGADLARASRDALLDHRGDDARALLLDLRYRAEHSRLLRWSLTGVGVVEPGSAAGLGLPASVVGDCRDRLLALVDGAVEAAHEVAGTTPPSVHGSRRPQVPLTAWGDLVAGCEFGAARLVVATLGSPPTLAEVPSRG